MSHCSLNYDVKALDHDINSTVIKLGTHRANTVVQHVVTDYAYQTTFLMFKISLLLDLADMLTA